MQKLSDYMNLKNLRIEDKIEIIESIICSNKEAEEAKNVFLMKLKEEIKMTQKAE